MTVSKYIDVGYSCKKMLFTNYPSRLIKELVKKFKLNLNSSISKLTRILVPEYFRPKFKWIRFSKEIMLLSFGVK